MDKAVKLLIESFFDDINSNETEDSNGLLKLKDELNKNSSFNKNDKLLLVNQIYDAVDEMLQSVYTYNRLKAVLMKDDLYDWQIEEFAIKSVGDYFEKRTGRKEILDRFIYDTSFTELIKTAIADEALNKIIEIEDL